MTLPFATIATTLRDHREITRLGTPYAAALTVASSSPNCGRSSVSSHRRCK